MILGSAHARSDDSVNDRGLTVSVCESVFTPSFSSIALSNEDVGRIFNREIVSLNLPRRISIQQLKTIQLTDRVPLEVFNFDYNEFARTQSSDHEIRSSIHYARNHLRGHNEHLLVLTHFAGISVPGFDGIIYDSLGNPTANYSLKSDYRFDGLQSVDQAIAKAKKFSILLNWYTLITQSNTPHDQNLIIQKGNFKKDFLPYVRDLAYLSKLLGVPEDKCVSCIPRKTRIVIDVHSQDFRSFPKDLLNQVLAKVIHESDFIESVLIMGSRQAVLIEPDGFKYY